MGLLTVVLAVLTFAFAAGAAWLAPPTWWMRALFWTLVLAPLTLFAAVGWLLRRRLGAAGAPWRWALPAGVLAGLAVAASFSLGIGPARIPQGGPLTIDLPMWLLAGAGLAGVVAAVGYGIAASASTARLAAAAGALLAVAAFLALQPALRDAGLPTVGPIGLAVAIAAVLLGRVSLARRGDGR